MFFLIWGLSLEENSELSQVTLWKLKALTLATDERATDCQQNYTSRKVNGRLVSPLS